MSHRADIEEVLHRGYDSGNYAAAYISENFRRAWDETLKEMDSDTRKLRHVDPKAFRAAFMLGFFSSYETHELPEGHVGAVVDADYDYGKQMRAAGIAVDSRS